MKNTKIKNVPNIKNGSLLNLHLNLEVDKIITRFYFYSLLLRPYQYKIGEMLSQFLLMKVRSFDRLSDIKRTFHFKTSHCTQQ